MSTSASESALNTVHACPFNNVGTRSSFFALSYSLAAAQTLNLLKHDLASSPRRGSGRAIPKPAMSSRGFDRHQCKVT